MEGHVAMEWKDPNPGHSSEDAQAGFDKHGFLVPISPPREQESRPLPLTPQFGQKTPGSSLADRREAKTGFKVPKLSLPFSTAAGAGADNSVSVSGAPSPYLTIPPGLSPASLLESPVFVSNAMGQPSPTTGKLFMSGGTNDNDPIRFGGPPVGDGPDAFSFKPLAHCTAAALKEHNIKVSVITEKSKNGSFPRITAFRKKFTETKAQPVQEANLLGQLNQLNQNVQTNMNSGGPHDSKLSRLASGTGAGNEHLSPPDYGQTAEEGDAREDYPAITVTAIVTAEDGYSWRKYGQKQVKHSEYPRSYFKCTHPNCPVKKKVERSHEGHITEIIYKSAHNHPKPVPSRPRQAGIQQPVPQPFSDTAGAQQADAADNNLGSSQQANAAAEANHQTPRRVGVQDGIDATSSPSVPGELCDSAASMQGGEYAPRGFGSPQGADVTSAPSDEVDADRVTLGSMSHGGADADGAELESKRRKLESYAIDMSTLSRGVREPRVVIQTTSEVDILDDGYRWRKYGQKVVKGNPNPRSYYKCTQLSCTVRKHVERASHDLKSVITTYEGKHNHEVPAARNSGGHQGTAAAAAGAGGVRSRPMHHPSVHDGLMMRHLGGCGVPFILPAPRDPLACLGSLPSLPMPPAGNISAVEGLKLPMLASDAAHEDLLLRRQRAMHQQAMQAAMVADMKVLQGNVAGGVTAAPSSVYQQMMRSGLRLGGHQM